MGRLHRAARLGKDKDIEQYLAEGDDIDAIGIRRLSPLMIAAQEGHLSTLELLLKAGADLSLAPRHQRTALHLAASKGHLSGVQALVAQGADIHARSSSGMSPAMEAAQFNHRDVALFLLELGTDPTFQDRGGMTAADWLAEGGIQGRSARSFPDALRDSPQSVEHVTMRVRKLMAEGLSADEFAAKHGRHTLIWSYGSYSFEDSEAGNWARRVAEIIFNPELLEQCEEQYLQEDALADARKCRERRNRRAQRAQKSTRLISG